MESTIQRRISILACRDLVRAYEHLVRVFGLGPGQLSRVVHGRVVHGELEAGDGMVWLHPESERFRLLSPSTVGAATGMVAVLVEDLDAHFRRAVAEGADIIYEPVDQPYGFRKYGARDPEGGLWSFMRPIT